MSCYSGTKLQRNLQISAAIFCGQRFIKIARTVLKRNSSENAKYIWRKRYSSENTSMPSGELRATTEYMFDDYQRVTLLSLGDLAG